MKFYQQEGNLKENNFSGGLRDKNGSEDSDGFGDSDSVSKEEKISRSVLKVNFPYLVNL